MMASVPAQNVLARKDTDFWKNVAPLIVPFDHPVFTLRYAQVKEAKYDECKICTTKKQGTKQRYSMIPPECKRAKTTQIQNYIKPLNTSSKTTQAQNNVKDCYVLLKRLELEDKETQRLSEENVLVSNEVETDTDMNSKRSKRIVKANSRIIETIGFENKNATLFPKHTTSTLDKDESESVLNARILKENFSENVLKNDFKLNMCPRVRLRRVEDSVRFLNCVNLQPKWTNSSLYQPTVTLKKLGKFRKNK